MHPYLRAWKRDYVSFFCSSFTEILKESGHLLVFMCVRETVADVIMGLSDLLELSQVRLDRKI